MPNAHDEAKENVTTGGKEEGDSFLEDMFMMPMLLSNRSVMVTFSNDRGVPCCSPSSLGVLIPASCLLRGLPVLEGRHVPGASAFVNKPPDGGSLEAVTQNNPLPVHSPVYAVWSSSESVQQLL